MTTAQEKALADNKKTDQQMKADQAKTDEQMKTASKEVSKSEQAKDAKEERQDMQIPERKDEVMAPAKTDPQLKSDAKNAPGKAWADYASDQEEAYKKNTGQPIERNVDGRVKP